jgi:hypothetical protein
MTTYYVRADGTAANKAAATGPASEQSACMSPDVHNGETFDSGDEILISSQGGTYTSQIIVPSSGVTDYITYKNVPDESPQFDLQIMLSSEDWTDLEDGRYSASGMSTVANVYKNGVPVPQATSTALDTFDHCWYWSSNVLYYRPPSGPPGSDIGYLHNTLVPALYILNKSKIKVSSSSGGRLEFGAVSQGVAVYATTGALNDNIVENTYHRYGRDGILTSATSYTNSGTIRNNEFYCTMSAIRLYGDDYNTWTIEDNYGWGVGSVDGTIRFHSTADQEFIGIQNPDSCIIRRNVSINGWNRFIFWYLNQSNHADDNEVYENFCYNNQKTFFRIGGTNFYGDDPATWSWNNNRIYSNIGASVASASGSSGWAVYLSQPMQEPTRTNYFYNNVIYGGSHGIMLAKHADADNINYGVTIKNNIWRNQRNYSVMLDGVLPSQINFDYNCWEKDYTGSQTGFYVDGYRTFAYWQETAGQDTNGFIADPLFINAGGDNPEDYRLNSGSPCIKAGTAVGLPILTTDFQGNRCRTTNPSMGAIEYFKIGGVISPKRVGVVHYAPMD